MNEAALATTLSLWQRALGPRYVQLPDAVQRFHRLAGKALLHGQVETFPPASPLARGLAWCLGTPGRASSGPMRFEVDATPDAETWTRYFPTQTMTSDIRLDQGKIEETIGAVRLTFALAATRDMMTMTLKRMTFLGVPCPTWLMPRIVAEERGDEDRLHFRVSAALPGVGVVASYRGHLQLDLRRDHRQVPRDTAMIVVFDAQCLLCNGWVQFILRHDRQGLLQFASIQGATGQRLLSDAGLEVDGLQTLLLVDGPRTWQHTAAIFRVLDALGWPWRMAWLAWLVPSPLRDPAYRLLARNRYRIFGRSDTCILPPVDYAARFLD